MKQREETSTSISSHYHNIFSPTPFIERNLTRPRLRGLVLLALVQISSKDTLYGANSGQDANTKTNVLPVQAATLVQAPGLVSQEGTQPNDASQVRDCQSSGASIGQLCKLRLQPVVGLFALLLGLGLLSSSLTLEARGLGFGLDVLVEEFGRDSLDGGGVDVDERRGGGGLVGENLGRLGSSSLCLISERVLSEGTEMPRGILTSSGACLGPVAAISA